jgi:hypothetical protein
MGFQLVSAQIQGQPTPLLVLNAEVAYDLSNLENRRIAGRITLESLTAVVLEEFHRRVDTLISLDPAEITLLAARVSRSGPLPVGSLGTAFPTTLIKSLTLTAPRRFHRYSPYSPDRRVDPATGNFVAGTHASPESETPFIPTGFAAVGRLALPSSSPASYHYEIEAIAGTQVNFGTIAPAFGQAGGGVEAFFPLGATSSRPRRAVPTSLPDE